MSRWITHRGMQLASVLGPLLALIVPASPVRADNISKAQVQEIVDGTWTLAEWTIDGNHLRPPEVDGRFSIHDGIVMFFLERRSPGNEIFVSGYGSYDLTE